MTTWTTILANPAPQSSEELSQTPKTGTTKVYAATADEPAIRAQELYDALTATYARS